MATTTKRTWTYKGEKKSAWIVRYTDKGGSRRQETFQLKRDADKYKLKVESEIENGTHVAISQSWTVKEAAEAYLADCERRVKIADRMSLTTLANYSNFARNHICGMFGTRRLTEIEAQEIQDWLNRQCDTFSRKSVERMHTVFLQIFAFSLRQKKVGRNPIVEGRVTVPNKKRARISVPSIADIKALITATDLRKPEERRLHFANRKIIIYLAVFCGLRKGEISALSWEDVDFESGVIHITKNYSLHDGMKDPKTYAGIRDLPISERVQDVLRSIHLERGSPVTGILVPALTGRRMYPSEVYDLWTTVAKRAGLADNEGKMKYHLHALRHAAASFLIADGVGPKHIATFMGHADIKTTFNTYGHLFPEDQAIRASIGKAFSRIGMEQEIGKTS